LLIVSRGVPPGGMSATETGAVRVRDEQGGGGASAGVQVRKRRNVLGAALAELIGTFMLLFFGLGAILAAGGADDAAQKLLIGLGFGLTILAAAYLFGHISGAHLNPAVTLGLMASGRFPKDAVPFYIAAQILGAILGALAVALVFPGAEISGTVTQPGQGVGWGEAFLAELLLGFVLMLVVKGTAVDDRAEGPSAGLAIGLIIAAGHLAFIPVSGASFNPARSIGSAVVGGEFGDLIIYLIAPVLGAVAAALLFEKLLHNVNVPDVDD
jgi:MIP family channel proteins